MSISLLQPASLFLLLGVPKGAYRADLRRDDIGLRYSWGLLDMKSGSQAVTDRRIRRVQEALERNQRLRPAEAASIVNLSRSRLDELFKVNLGIRLGYYMRD